MRAEIVGAGPGAAVIRIVGGSALPPAEAFQIQRNQMPEAYLAPGNGWQTSPDHWVAFGPGNLQSKPEGLEFRVGPDIVDPIVAALTRSTFRLTLRGGGKTTALSLTPAAQMPLLSSGARARPGQMPADIAPQKPPPVVEAPPVPEKGSSPPEPPPPLTPPGIGTGKRKGAGLALLAGLAILLAAGGVAIWVYRDQVLALIHGSSTPASQPAPPSNAPLPPTASSTSPSGLTLRDELQQFMNSNPTVEAMMQKASSMAGEGKSEGALYLYRQAVDKGNMEAALALGRFYDPTEAGNNANSIADAQTASFWYAKAAAANIAEAQRRLGILQTRNGPNSSTYSMGIENLKKASDQGDAEAANKLRELQP